MHPYLAEFIGTALLILLGDGVVANVCLKDSKGQNGGWIVVTVGWGLAVAISVYCVGSISGGHLNPAVTLGLASIGQFAWALVPGYVLAQLLGAMLGAVLVWIAYQPHWRATPEPATKLGVFCTRPALRQPAANFGTEMIGTFVLVLGVLAIPSADNLDPATGFSKGFGPFLVGLLVLSIGLSLGGPTGYAINPARDLGPRLAHALLPIPGKGSSEFAYAWVPALGPVAGGILAALVYRQIWLP
jgi:glycerol uptake facilitator protein